MTASPDYAKMFDQFFKRGQMFSTYKTAFLYALTDIGLYDDGDLIGRHWIKQDGNFVTLKLDFLAIRLARYYWEILDSGIRHVPKAWAEKRGDINIFEILRNEKRLKIPTLEELEHDSMSNLRKKVIEKSIKQEVLKNLSTKEMQDLYTENRYKNTISLHKSIIYFMKHNMKQIKVELGIKMADHLENRNPAMKTFEEDEAGVNKNSPFYTYIQNHHLSPTKYEDTNPEEHSSDDRLEDMSERINELRDKIRDACKRKDRSESYPDYTCSEMFQLLEEYLNILPNDRKYGNVGFFIRRKPHKRGRGVQ